MYITDAIIGSRFNVVISLDEINSSGHRNSDMDFSKSRPMALSLKDNGVWYGFIVTRCESDRLRPGEKISAEIAFLNGDDAHVAFPLGSSALFGDGVMSKGVISIVEHVGRRITGS